MLRSRNRSRAPAKKKAGSNKASADEGEDKKMSSLFAWYPEANFIFRGKAMDIQKNIVGMAGEDKTKTLKEMSIAIKFTQMNSVDSDMTLVSHSNCGCYALQINSEHYIQFKKRCGSDYIFNTNY